MANLLKWQQDYIDIYLKNSTNAELLDTVLTDAGGDGYDGYFTEKGTWKFEHAMRELCMRLVITNWIIPEQARYLMKTRGFEQKTCSLCDLGRSRIEIEGHWVHIFNGKDEVACEKS